MTWRDQQGIYDDPEEKQEIEERKIERIMMHDKTQREL